MKYQEAMDYIDACAGFGIVPGLDSIRELLNRLENPQQKLKFIHIAGTNGKGSTLAFLLPKFFCFHKTKTIFYFEGEYL